MFTFGQWFKIKICATFFLTEFKLLGNLGKSFCDKDVTKTGERFAFFLIKRYKIWHISKKERMDAAQKGSFLKYHRCPALQCCQKFCAESPKFSDKPAFTDFIVRIRILLWSLGIQFSFPCSNLNSNHPKLTFRAGGKDNECGSATFPEATCTTTQLLVDYFRSYYCGVLRNSEYHTFAEYYRNFSACFQPSEITKHKLWGWCRF